MNRKEQINNLAADIYSLIRSSAMSRALAELLVDKGYCKASEVAEEIIGILKSVGIDEWRYPVIAEIKKKYTESEKDNDTH